MVRPWNCALATALAIPASALADDWPQWRGPTRNGISRERAWSWQRLQPAPVISWKASVGNGHSSVAVKEDRAYTMGNIDNTDTIWCLDAGSGNVVWKFSYPCEAGQYAGPRATPTIEENRLYTLSRDGVALCLDAATGKVIWRRRFKEQAGAKIPKWGFSSSPLIEGNLLILNVGSAGVALDKRTGKQVWRSSPGIAGYASPVAYTVARRRILGIFSSSGLSVVDPKNGKSLWHYPWSWNDPYRVNVADPIFAGQSVFISSDYNRGCALLRHGKAKPAVTWRNEKMRNHVNTSILLNGYLYGNDQGTLKCIALNNGQERWSGPRIGKGGLIASDGKLIVLTERGELVVATATPDHYEELASVRILNPICYTPPTLANGRIYCRNHSGDVVCIDVRN